MSREDQIINERIRKINELNKLKIHPYAYRFDKEQNTKEILEKNEKLKADERTKTIVKTAGRLLTIRDMGNLIFGHIQDQFGKIQIVLQKGETDEKKLDLFKKYIDAGDFVGVSGIVFKTKRGEVSILVKEVELLTKSILPLPEKWHGLTDKEERYRKRYLDLVMNPESREVFNKRANIIAAIREFLVKKGYIEVETPVLQPIYGGTSARPFESRLNALDMKVYMRISNEMYLKRLIGGGYERIFEFSRDFRNEGIDATHNPEFTLMETMCAYADYRQNMDLVEEMLEFVAKKALGTTKVNYQGKEIDFKRPWKRIKMVDAIKQFAKLDVEKMSEAKLKEKIKELKIELPVFKRGIAIEAIFGEVVTKELIQPTIVYDFPTETCGLAKPKSDDPNYAERFEPYINGWELGNVYSELNNPLILEKYWKDQESMLAKNDEAQRLDEDFLNMLKVGMPPTSGVGIGVDRLVMLLTNSPSIRDVLMFPFMKPEVAVKDKQDKEDKKK